MLRLYKSAGTIVKIKCPMSILVDTRTHPTNGLGLLCGAILKCYNFDN
jgi:hypothetical protein